MANSIIYFKNKIIIKMRVSSVAAAVVQINLKTPKATHALVTRAWN